MQVESLLGSASLVLLSEGIGFFKTFADMLVESQVFGAAGHDARIAALCLHHGVTTLYTADRDFSRFPRLKTSNPFVG